MDANRDDTDFPAPLWSMLEFEFSSRDTDANMTAICNGRRVVVRITANKFTLKNVRDKYLFFLEVAENFELDEYTVEKFYDWIAEPLIPFFEDLDKQDPPPQNLDAFLFQRRTISPYGSMGILDWPYHLMKLILMVHCSVLNFLKAPPLPGLPSSRPPSTYAERGMAGVPHQLYLQKSN